MNNERDIINGVLRSIGFSNPQESYSMMMKQTQELLMSEIKKCDLSKEEIDEICKTNGLDGSEDAVKVARKVEELVRSKFGIPKL